MNGGPMKRIKPRITFHPGMKKWYCTGGGRTGSGYTPRDAFVKWLNGIIVEAWHANGRKSHPRILHSMFAADMRAHYGLMEY